MTKSEKYKSIIREAKKTSEKLDELYEQKGTYDAPVEMDLVKTVKSMFFENVMSILRKENEEESK